MNPIIILLSWLAVIEAKVLIDWYQIVKLKNNIAHGWEMIGVIFVYILWGYFVAHIRAVDTWAQDVTVFAGCSYWLLFDGLLSWHRGLNFFYIGENAKSDKFWKRMGLGAYFMSKVFALIGTAYGVTWVLRHA